VRSPNSSRRTIAPICVLCPEIVICRWWQCAIASVFESCTRSIEILPPKVSHRHARRISRSAPTTIQVPLKFGIRPKLFCLPDTAHGRYPVEHRWTDAESPALTPSFDPVPPKEVWPKGQASAYNVGNTCDMIERYSIAFGPGSQSEGLEKALHEDMDLCSSLDPGSRVAGSRQLPGPG
jgi:hypothetical protein